MTWRRAAVSCRQCDANAQGHNLAFWKGYCDACWQTECSACGEWRPDMISVPASVARDLDFAAGWLCGGCRDNGVTMEEARFLMLLPLFRIWDRGRREESGRRQAHDNGLGPTRIPRQPSRVGRRLYLGDLDDALDTTMLLVENIQGVLCLCPDRLDRKARAGLETAKSRGVAVRTVEAHDDPDFDIMTNAWPAARKLLRSWVGAGMSRILIVCWGGVNRSAAIAGAWLRSAENMSFAMTMETLTRARGTVLTNMSFRRALLTCFRDAQGRSSRRSLALDGRPGSSRRS
jgi:hypothetical protein